MLAGLQLPTSGTIAINDYLLSPDEDTLRAYRRTIGVVFQSWNLFPHLTALENIVLPLHRVHGIPLEEAEQRSLELLQRFQLAEHAHKKPSELSGGQAQRVALMRAVAHHPQLLFLDEPTSALDPLMTAEVLDLVMELKQEGRNLVIVTHHLTFARKIADHVLFMADGKVLESGSADLVFGNPKTALAQLYMSKTMNY